MKLNLNEKCMKIEKHALGDAITFNDTWAGSHNILADDVEKIIELICI